MRYDYRANGQLNGNVKVVREPKSYFYKKKDMVIPCRFHTSYKEVVTIDKIFFENEYAVKLDDYEGYYVTKSGKIISVKVKGGNGKLDYSNPRRLSEKVDKDGYHEVCLSMIIDGKQKRLYRKVHRLVWIGFNGNIPNELTIDHIDSDVDNNNLNNLQLLSREDNTSKARRGKVTWQKGKKHTSRKMYNVFIRNIYIGTFDKKELYEIFKLTRYDVDNYSNKTKRKNKLNMRLEIYVEDIERVGND